MDSMLLANKWWHHLFLIFVPVKTEIVKGLDDRYYEVQFKVLNNEKYLVDYWRKPS